MSKTLRLLGISLGAFIIFNILLETIFSGHMYNFVIYMTIGFTVFLYSLFYPKIKDFCKSNILKILNAIIRTGILFFAFTFCIVSALIYTKSLTTPKTPPDAIIVLGAGLKGDKVSMPLAERLKTAADYYEENSDTIIVVSGGQGPTELVTEAHAMKEYLINLGIPSNQIIEEGLSTRTMENLSFSKEILDDYFKNEDYTIVYVTNGSHVFRSGLIANQLDFEAESIGAKNVPLLAVNQYIYEYFALIKYLVLDYN